MPALTKKEIKKVFIEALEPFARATEKDFQRIDKRFDGVDKSFDEVEGRLDKVEAGLFSVKTELAEVKKDVKWMKDNSSGLFTKLDELIGFYKDQRQELLLLNGRVRRLEEEVAQLKTKRGG